MKYLLLRLLLLLQLSSWCVCAATHDASSASLTNATAGTNIERSITASPTENSLLSDAPPKTSWDRFMFHLRRGEPFKAWQLYPWTMSLGVLLIGLVGVLGTLLLLRPAFVLPRVLRPGIFYFLAWLVYNYACQLFCTIVWPGGLVWGMCVGALPLAAAGWKAFPRCGWGGAYRWPKWSAFQWTAVGIALIFPEMFFSGIYITIITQLFHLQDVAPRNVAPILLMIQTSPALAVLVIVFLAPFVEEVLFRGLLFDAIKLRCGGWTVLWTALAFGAMHMDPVFFVPLSILGLILGFVRWKSGSIWASFFVHTFVNALGIVGLIFLRKMHLG